MNLDDISVQKGCGISQKAAASLRASLPCDIEGGHRWARYRLP